MIIVGCIHSVGGYAGHFTGLWSRGGGLLASATPVPGVVLIRGGGLPASATPVPGVVLAPVPGRGARHSVGGSFWNSPVLSPLVS